MRTIIKKIDTEWYDLVVSGRKKYELRLADFEVDDADILRLEEWVEENGKRKFTGRFIEKKVTYLRKVDLKKWIKNQPELIEKGFYVLQFE